MVVVQNIKLANLHRQCQIVDGEDGRAQAFEKKVASLLSLKNFGIV
jgi:hypothetical protein